MNKLETKKWYVDDTVIIIPTLKKNFIIEKNIYIKKTNFSPFLG